jgi:hypothetical protein
MQLLKTFEAAQEIGVDYGNLHNAMQRGYVPRPAKDRSGHLIWSAADIANARRILAARKKRKPSAAAGVA